MNSITPLPKDWLPRLSQQLAETFSARENQAPDFYSPEVLEWKYFRPRGDGPLPRSFVLIDGERIKTHIGAVFTDFRSTDAAASPISALHMIDWFSAPDAGPGASALLASVLKKTAVQYALGSSLAARKVMLGFRYQEISPAPAYRSVPSRLKSGVWKTLHGQQSFPRKIALLAFDFAQSFKARAVRGNLKIEATRFFGTEVETILQRSPTPFIFTMRSAELLNYFLAHPHKIFTGWVFRDGKNIRGFALTSCFPKAGIRAGNIVDCFLDSNDPPLWAEAFSLLRDELKKQAADVVNCYGSLPWVKAALERSGFFRRGRTPFYLRDMENKLPADAPYFLTHIEGDAAIL